MTNGIVRGGSRWVYPRNIQLTWSLQERPPAAKAALSFRLKLRGNEAFEVISFFSVVQGLFGGHAAETIADFDTPLLFRLCVTRDKMVFTA